MKKTVLIFLLLAGCISLPVFTDNIHSYSIEEIGTLSSGSEEGQIGWQSRAAGRETGPVVFTITDEGDIYIPDRANERINVYSSDFKFLRVINEEGRKRGHYAEILYIDRDDNLIYYDIFTGFAIIDQNGKRLVDVSNRSLPKNQVRVFKNIFLIENDIYMYNDKNQPVLMTKEGQIQSPEDTQAELQELFTGSSGIIKDLLDSGTYLIAGNRYFSTQFWDNEAYYKQVRTLSPNLGLRMDLSRFSIKFAGYDSDHNSYWRAIEDSTGGIRNQVIFVYSKYGALLDAFYYGRANNRYESTGDFSTTNAVVSVSPAGDVYFLVGTREEYSLFKVKRSW